MREEMRHKLHGLEVMAFSKLKNEPQSHKERKDFQNAFVFPL